MITTVLRGFECSFVLQEFVIAALSFLPDCVDRI